MRFEPKSEEQINEERLLPKGEYDFEVMDAIDKFSKKGNEMIQVELRVFRPDGGTVYVTDYLMEALLYKLLHFCSATGLTALYEKGTLTADDCIGKVGRVKIKEERQEGYLPKNAVSDYVVVKDGATPTVPPIRPEVKDADDDIPF